MSANEAVKRDLLHFLDALSSLDDAA